MNASVHQSSSLLHFSDCIANASSDAHQILKGMDNGINRDSPVAALDVKNTSEVPASRAFADNRIGEKFRNTKIVNRVGHVMLPHSNPPSLAAGHQITRECERKYFRFRAATRNDAFNSNFTKHSHSLSATLRDSQSGASFIPSVHADKPTNIDTHSDAIGNIAIDVNPITSKSNAFIFKPSNNL